LWGVSDIEGLALIEGIRENYAFLFNSDFLVYSDHISLKWLNTIKNVNGRLGRWSLLLQPLRFTVHHKPGHANANADGLSRRQYPPTTDADPDDDFLNDAIELANVNVVNTEVEVLKDDPDEAELRDEDREFVRVKFKYHKTPSNINVMTEPVDDVISTENVKQLQLECPDAGRIITYLQTNELPQDPKLARETVFQAEEYFFKDGVLFHHYTPKNKHVAKAQPIIEQLVVPTSLRMKVLHQFHDLNGHSGFDRTYATIRSR